MRKPVEVYRKPAKTIINSLQSRGASAESKLRLPSALGLLFILCFLFFFSSIYGYAKQKQNVNPEQEGITISGRVTDFEGNPIDSAAVRVLYSDFSPAYETYSGPDGYYQINNIKKGRYKALFAMRMKEYPRMNAVPEEDMRLEFWAWNVIADRDLVINPRYQKLELYGTTVFEELGGRPELLVYFRPMSVTKNLTYGKDIYLNKSKLEAVADLSVSPGFLEVEVSADNEPLRVIAVHPIYEGRGKEKKAISYIAQVERPKQIPQKPYVIFKVTATNKEFNEKGENLYFYEPGKYERSRQLP